jgi:hypothetical protein
MVWFQRAGYSNLNPCNGSSYVNDWFETAYDRPIFKIGIREAITKM